MNTLNILNSLDIDFFFLVVDPHLNINLPQLKNFYSIYDPNLPVKNSGYLLSQPSTQQFIKQTTNRSGHRTAIIPFKPSAKVDLICQKNQWLKISNPAPLNRLFEDKIKFFQICQQHQIPIIDGLVGNFNSSFLDTAIKQFGLPLVLQTHFGWAGNSTHLINCKTNALQIIPKDTIVKISPLLGGYSLLNNCCLTSVGLIQSPPALQYTGLKPLTNNPFATVGRQWPAPAPKSVISQVESITNQFSQVLDHYHYRGFFGLDFFVHKNRVFLLECNPRLTASFAFYTEIELKHQLDPLFFFHLLEFTSPSQVDISHQYRFHLPFIGSEITLKNDQSTTIKKYHNFTAFSDKCHPITIPDSIIQQLYEKD